jgi:signal peptidase I
MAMTFSKYLKITVFAVSILGLTSAYVRAFTVAGPSMSPTLLYGDLVVSNHAAYDFRLPYMDNVLIEVSDPQRGDVITYFDVSKNVIAIKRLIGIPGDTVRMKSNTLYVNGAKATERIVSQETFDDVLLQNTLGQLVSEEMLGGVAHLITYTPGNSPVRSFEEITITEGNYFILGDNRDNSADSRYIGFISRDQIKGRVFRGIRTLDSF